MSNSHDTTPQINSQDPLASTYDMPTTVIPAQHKHRKPYRKKPVDTESRKEELQQSEQDVSLKLLQTKELQKLRGRSKGVNAGVASELNLPPSTSQDTPQRSFDSNFTTQQDKPEVNQHLEKYIEENMKKKEQEMSELVSTEKPASTDGDLYTTPDHLKAESKVNSDTTNWLTGIVEVQLPMEYKLKNIEETEKAKRELMQHIQPETRPTFGENNLYGPSFANIRYQTDRQPIKRAAPGNATVVGGGVGGALAIGVTGNERATDDIVMDRFKKRFRK